MLNEIKRVSKLIFMPLSKDSATRERGERDVKLDLPNVISIDEIDQTNCSVFFFIFLIDRLRVLLSFFFLSSLLILVFPIPSLYLFEINLFT